MKLSQVYSPSTMTVLIVGGGIGGIATALAFQRHGIKALVFERASQFREVGSGMILAGNAVEVLHKLGLAYALLSFAAPLRSSHLRSWQEMCWWTCRCRRPCSALGQAQLRSIEPNS
jgi:2-polyprenyl-6-methoxyphenol hydroxylase-like FAD-dependent oxidoreductase